VARRSPNRERLIAALCPGHLPGWLLSVVPGLKLKAATGVRREHGGQKPRIVVKVLVGAESPARSGYSNRKSKTRQSRRYR
jgi:hypothetical protein